MQTKRERNNRNKSEKEDLEGNISYTIHKKQQNMEQTTRPQNENVFAEVKEYLIDKVNGKINNEFDLLEKLHLGKYNNIVEHLKNERIFDNDISEIEDFKNRKNIVGLTNEQVQEKIQNLKGEINGEQTADNSETIRHIRADIENYETQLSNREKGIPETILKAKFEDIPPYKIGEKITDFIDRKVEDWGLKNDFEKLKSLQIDNIFEKNINLDEFKENLVNRIKSQNPEVKETPQEKIYNQIVEASKNSNEGYSPLETYQNLKNTAEKMGLSVALKDEAHPKLDDNEKANVYLAYYKNQEKLPIETGIILGDGKAKTFLERINQQTNEMTFEADASKSYTAEKQWQVDALKSAVQKHYQNIAFDLTEKMLEDMDRHTYERYKKDSVSVIQEYIDSGFFDKEKQNIKMETQQENVQNFIGKMVFSDHGKTQTELDKERLQEYKNLTPEEKNMVKEMGVREAINLIEEVGEKTISQEGIKKTQEHFERIINEAEREQTTKQSSSQNENIEIEQKLSLKDKYITPLTKEYKDFVKEMENSSPEAFYMDGERSFTEKEKKFMQIYDEKQGIKSPQIFLSEAEKEQTTKQSPSQNENIYNDKQKQEEKIKSPIESAQLDYLKNQLKYLGFGESNKLHQDLEKGINSNEKTFKIQTQSDRAMQGNEVNFTLNFNKSEKGGVFLNSFNATLKNEIGEEKTHNFGVNHFTAKEAVNLLEGRSVKTEFKENEPVFVKLNFAEEKNEYGNFKFQTYNQQAYGVDTAKIVEKSGLIFDKPEHKDNTVKSLEKGNIVKVKFNLDNKITEGNAVLNPQYKTLNLYDKEMNRLNTNKPIQGLDTQQQEKNNIRQQNISRSL